MEDVFLSNPVTLDALPRQPRHQLACFERAISENNHFTNVYNRLFDNQFVTESALRGLNISPLNTRSTQAICRWQLVSFTSASTRTFGTCADELGRHTHHIRPVRVPV